MDSTRTWSPRSSRPTCAGTAVTTLVSRSSEASVVRRANQAGDSGASQDSGSAPGVDRTRLLESSVGLVEDVRTAGATRTKASEDFSPKFQVALPYRGLFVWHVGRDDMVSDANQVLFVTGGESYRLSEPLSGGCGELVITPEPSILMEIAHAADSRLSRHSLFLRRSRRADPRLQSLRAHFLYWATGVADVDDLVAEEMTLTLLRSALVDDAPRNDPPDASRRLILRTKEFLGAEFPHPIRLRDVGRAVGASPTYLTGLFRHVEGVPLHRYLVQLRLAHALVELPHTADLTGLALVVGFSSHSHFSAAFQRTFGCTPSQFRQRARNLQLP